ncbi:bifunctional tetrahydrofolate synthase/dihydrofolate synthase [Buchnera aphidicola]|jgi:dihydrofolate synthase/folylpolyglutamate synthase|uniref:Dihydrofolate synthase/folylpolyglutamate synthase n=1 Tax=Buchnera aphidicola subsp. Schizaphis graminum (strain Sg) TaxID=198804 RepID=FOLC_BUCAP|nr:bifunctional tetrahydrofolate synthase/dihydrofolate synthase [Buchnera aphidicola]Q8K9X3.1 RecName: Full=Dihydrofolate synthase/folylpolyglutamate synthase; Short=DHFS / FPGS; AltName: Full=Folylpoly-gamma-glutamate synthetase-dihydrofolate synthetase; AltName: Full=Folylpolyglutamate synthetase; AltName: Full=Tetrahydrofolylpolyglutamate synthase [Buchnera aphidicola str. Sg (Schizaphis graminum)]AAM67729.1 FolC bifunctional protein [Buchnera aphidicola str. Sg (Schizaphis graminum)]AWI4977
MHKKKYTFSMWMKYLEKFDKKDRKNLFELKLIAKKLGLLNLKSFFFTVGGTNGKGTTCAMLEKLLLDSGYQVGLYTSPHLINYSERIKVNGLYLSEKDHIFSFLIIDAEKGNVSLTYFEFITLSALFLFSQYSLDIIILEVGLGGRLDATNIIDSDLSVITNIGIDHTSCLGTDRISIGREKSGIFRKGKIAVIGEKNIPISVDEIAKEKKTILKKIDVDWFWTRTKIDSWNFIHSNIELYNLPVSRIPLSNTAIALASLFYSGLEVNLKKLKSSISKVQLSGRFQTVFNSPRIILDVAHNVHAALYLSEKIDEIDTEGQIYAVFGILKDKDVAGVVQVLQKKINYWYVVNLKTNRSASINYLKKKLSLNNALFFNNINESWQAIKKVITKKDIILVFGSFFTVSEFMSIKDRRLTLY